MIEYRAGYKYQETKTYSILVDIHPPEDIISDFLRLSKKGTLRIIKGYAWDGPSGPTRDSKWNMRASLVHDALYQLIREGKIDVFYREYIDKLFYQILLEVGKKLCKTKGFWFKRTYKTRAWLYYKGVKKAGARFAKPGNTKPILTAP